MIQLSLRGNVEPPCVQFRGPSIQLQRLRWRVSGGGTWNVRRSSLFSTQTLGSRGDPEEMWVKKNGNL